MEFYLVYCQRRFFPTTSAVLFCTFDLIIESCTDTPKFLLDNRSNAISDFQADTLPLPEPDENQTQIEQPTKRGTPIWQLIVLLLLVTAIGIGVTLFLQKGSSPTYNPQVSFRDVDRSQEITIDDFTSLRFSTSDGEKKSIAELSDARFTVLVITRGWSENLCLYCIAQTAQWAGKQSELQKLESQLLLVFPVASRDDADKLDLLHERVKQEGAYIDFPTLLDFDLESVNQLGIRAQLSKPATYIIDREGKVRFAYVGQSIADRPTVESVISQLKNLHSESSQ